VTGRESTHIDTAFMGLTSPDGVTSTASYQPDAIPTNPYLHRGSPAATREALEKLGQWLDSDSRSRCCTETKNGADSPERNRPLSWVGDTGIEPVTSLV
jgi:hypothetical protein